jgi:hypothetical protein
MVRILSDAAGLAAPCPKAAQAEMLARRSANAHIQRASRVNGKLVISPRLSPWTIDLLRMASPSDTSFRPEKTTRAPITMGGYAQTPGFPYCFYERKNEMNRLTAHRKENHGQLLCCGRRAMFSGLVLMWGG